MSGRFVGSNLVPVTVLASVLLAGPSFPRLASAALAPRGDTACVADATTLCFFSGRFSASLVLHDASERTGPGTAVPLNDAEGYFTFAAPTYVELFVKVVDGCLINDHFWVGYGSLTDSEFTLTVVDTDTGATRQYLNALGARANLFDVEAFATCVAPPSRSGSASVGLVGGRPAAMSSPGVRGSEQCVPGPTTHCLVGGRFEVEMTYTAGGTGNGQTRALTDHSGGFYFFDDQSVDAVVKLVEGCNFVEAHFSSPSNLEMEVSITEIATGVTRTLSHPGGLPLPAQVELEAFEWPECAFFSDGFESGNTTAWSTTAP